MPEVTVSNLVELAKTLLADKEDKGRSTEQLACDGLFDIAKECAQDCGQMAGAINWQVELAADGLTISTWHDKQSFTYPFTVTEIEDAILELVEGDSGDFDDDD